MSKAENEHCGDLAPHPSHEHRTPAYTGVWKQCDGTPDAEEARDEVYEHVRRGPFQPTQRHPATPDAGDASEESADAAHAALTAGIEALADEWASVPADEDAWAYEKARILRALLAESTGAGR